MNSREDILSEINMLRIMVNKLWEEVYGKIDKEQWDDFRKEVVKKMRNN